MATVAGEDSQVLQQQLALDVYLQNLLEEIPGDTSRDNSHPEPEPEPEPALAVTAEPIIPESRGPAASLRQSAVPGQSAVSGKASVVEQNRALAVMPAWAQKEFLALFFRVGKLLLATPLCDLQHMRKMPEKLGRVPGQSSWFLGLMEDQGRQVGILDTGQLLFASHRGAVQNCQSRDYARILVVHGKKWALACDEVLSISRLPSEKVRWRTRRQNRPWLIGTLTEELIAVIDIDQLLLQTKIE